MPDEANIAAGAAKAGPEGGDGGNQGDGAMGGAPTHGSGGGEGGDPALPENWKQLWIDQEYQGEQVIAEIGSVGNLAKAYVHAQKMVGKNPVALPDKSAEEDPEAWNDVWKRLGRPDSADDYQLPDVPEGIEKSEAIDGWLRNTAHSMGLAGWQVKKLYESFMTEAVPLAVGEVQTRTNKTYKEGMDALRAEYGAETDDKVNSTRILVEEYGGPEVQEMLKQTGVGNDPTFIKFMINIAEQNVEDMTSLVGGRQLAGGKTRAEAETEMGGLWTDPEFMKAYEDANHPGHARAVDRMNSLARIVHG